MSFRVNYGENAGIRPKTKPAKDSDYLAWLHKLPCCISGRTPVQAAHLSTTNVNWGHFGRGKSQKASDRFALPLHAHLHANQHAGNELDFWKRHGVNPYLSAVILHGMFCDGMDPEMAGAIVARLRSKATRDFMMEEF